MTSIYTCIVKTACIDNVVNACELCDCMVLEKNMSNICWGSIVDMFLLNHSKNMTRTSYCKW